MKLNKIRLDNIRSYISKEIEFPKGKVLLWGNIGSGKSSILLAIDFVLFGLQRTELAGASLLRNGADEGSVELFFNIEEKEYVLKRNLKRTKTGVVQDYGYVIIEGVKYEKTALELKQFVLELLNYPKDLLTKNKSLIYKYTVYTPQDEMKSILLESKEERLDTLRKVFGVDKYKRIKENAKTVSNQLRELKKLYEGATSDIQEKIFMKENKETEKSLFEDKLKIVLPIIEDKKFKVERKKEELLVVEKNKEEFNKIKTEISLVNLKIKHKAEEKIDQENKLNRIQKEIIVLEGEKLELIEDVKETIKDLDSKVTFKEKELRELLNKINEFKVRKAHSLQTKLKIESLNHCPTCLQEVYKEHKDKIIGDANKDIEEFDKQVKNNQMGVENIEKEIRNLKENLDFLKKKDSEIGLIRLKIQNLENKKKEFFEIQEKVLLCEKGIKEGYINLEELNKKYLEFSSFEKVGVQLKQELDRVLIEVHKFEMEKVSYEASINHLTKGINELIQEINKKNILREKKEYINKVQFWLNEHFVPMMEIMEKNVLFKVHAEFNNLFENWFSLLIDNNILQMSLDEEYTPKILQNGYDVEYQFLSGGEKTAGALAYRLALNQVINNMNTGLKTKDLLILDEPTDGFSSEQLNRLKVLMEEINIPQIIIVSHEQEVESFVEHIIRLEKVGHETKLI